MWWPGVVPEVGESHQGERLFITREKVSTENDVGRGFS